MGRPSKYPPEFRREAVELVKTSDRSPLAGSPRKSTLLTWIGSLPLSPGDTE